MKEDKRTADERRRDIFLGRRVGMSPEAKERLKEAHEVAIWTGTCRKCKAKIKGTIEECRGHKCDG